MSHSWPATGIAVVIALSPLFAAERGQALPTPIEYGQGRQLCSLAARDVDESSGVASSRCTKGVFWTHNDSGDDPRIFAFNAEGNDLATFELQGAINQDWEDMASFVVRGVPWLLVADIGDNAELRDQYTLYLLREPRVDPARRKVRDKVRVDEAVDFRYEDGPHDCEAVGVDAASGLIILVTKCALGNCKVFALGLPKERTREVLVAKAIGALRMPLVTAMDISPDGLRALVLTYGNGVEFTRRPGETWAAAFARSPRGVDVLSRRQGEAVCYGFDGKTLYLTSEGKPCPFFEIPVVGGR